MDARPSPSAASLNNRARLERISEPWSLNRSLAIAVTLVLAMVLGTWAAGGEFEKIILMGVWFAAVMIIVFVRDHWWSPALIITALSFGTTALGFPLSGLEIGMIILALTFPVKMAMKTLRKAEPEMDPGVFYWLLLAYVCGHAIVILGYSKIEGSALKNIVKAYYSAIAPLVFYGLLIRYCYTRTVRPAVIALFTATSVAVFFSLITAIFGLDIQPFSDLRITIGWLNSRGAAGILRQTTIFLFIGSIAYWPAVKANWARFVLASTTVMSATGALLSGGRITVATCIAGAFFFALVRKRVWLALPAIIVTMLISATITVKPEILYYLPDMVQRALTPFNFSSQQTEIQASLGGSDDWHRTLRDESIPYWMADTGSFFVGHGFKAWDQSLNDEYDDGGDIMDFDRQKQLAIEMGATENMFSSVTNIFGLVGLLLYGGFLIHLAFRLWNAIQRSPERSAARSLCEFSLVNLIAALVLCPFEGGTPSIGLVYWGIGLLAARPFIAVPKKAPLISLVDRPAFARPAFEGKPSRARPPRLRPHRA
jgi:hypothetical protein